MYRLVPSFIKTFHLTDVVSNHGQFPNADTPARHQCLVVGPMCRYAEDLLPMYKIMAAPHTAMLKLDEKVNCSYGSKTFSRLIRDNTS